MNQNKHTPGPWVISACDGGWTCIREEKHPSNVIAQLVENNEANGYVLAASTDLLGALESLVDVSARTSEEMYMPSDASLYDPNFETPWDKARRVIEMARGKEDKR